MLRSLSLWVLVILASARAEEWDLTNPPQTLKGKKDRAKALELWTKACPTFERALARARKPVDPDDVRAALLQIEEAVRLWEKSLDREWNGDANLELAEAAKAWYVLKPLAKPPERG